MRSPARQPGDHRLRGLGLVVLVQGQQLRAGRVDAIGAQQALRVARVLAGDRIDDLQHVQRAQRDVGQVADRRRDHVERRLRIMLRARGIARGLQGGAERSGCEGGQRVSPEQDDREVATADDQAARRRGGGRRARPLAGGGPGLVARNYRTPGRGGGEIDLIMRDPRDGTLVFVEVRQRASGTHGGAGGSITRREAAPHRLRGAALHQPASRAAALPLRRGADRGAHRMDPAAFDAG